MKGAVLWEDTTDLGLSRESICLKIISSVKTDWPLKLEHFENVKRILEENQPYLICCFGEVLDSECSLMELDFLLIERVLGDKEIDALGLEF